MNIKTKLTLLTTIVFCLIFVPNKVSPAERVFTNDYLILNYVEPQKPITTFVAESVVTPTKFVVKSVPSNRNAFAYMYYTAITSRGSVQYKLQQQAQTNEKGFRTIGDYYLVAMGSYYGKAGDRLQITLANGFKYKVMLGDIKSDVHTNSTNQVGQDGSIIEFILDKKVIANHSIFVQNAKPLMGSIIKIEKEL